MIGIKKISRLFMAVFAIGMLLFIGGCSTSSKKPAATEQPNSQVTYVKGPDFVGVVKAVDKEALRITLYNTSFEGTQEYVYSGATEIFSKYDRDMAVDEIEIGEAFEVYTNDDGSRIHKMKQASDLIVAEDTVVSIDSEQKRLTVQDVTYAYSDNMVTYSNGQYIDPMEIASGDKVTFRGVRGQAYSLVVTRGHGYIKPVKYSDFIGGTLIVHGEAVLPVSKNMLLSVPEGTQKITMASDGMTGTADVQVKRGQVTTLDMSRFAVQSPDIAKVKFKIEPEGAELYINGSLVDYSKAVKLRYGTHSIQVVLEGYQDYSGILNVKDPNPTIKISLPQETAQVESDDSSKSGSSVSSNKGSSSGNSSGNGSGSSSGASTASAEYDVDHKVTVSAPKGAAVYVDGTYKGEVPCSFTKMIGKITLTLSMEGYTTKSYQLEISDDSQDITWSFPELPKKGVG